MDYEPSQLPDVNAVELVDLKGIELHRGREYMRTKDALCVRIKGGTAQQISHLWRQLPPDEQARCHVPPFGLRFYFDNKLLVQGSVCWACNNIWVEENGKDFVYTFDGGHKYSRQLLDILKKIAAQSF